MDDDLDTTPVNKKPMSLSEVFEIECVNAMAFGMSYSDYWDGDIEMLWFYAKRYYTDIKSESIRDDSLAWMIGYYVSHGHSVVLSHAFSKHSTAKYFEKPQFTVDKKEEEAKQHELETLKSYRNLVLFAQSTGVAIEEATS